MMTISEYAASLELDYFEAAQALHWYAVNWHQGQSSELYAIQCELRYTPGACERGPEADSTAEIVYSDLEAGTIEPRALLEWIKAEYQKAHEDD
jgi:hypothetical protein